MKEHSESGLLSIVAYVVMIQTVRKRRMCCESERVGGKEREWRRAAERAGGEEGEQKVVN